MDNAKVAALMAITDAYEAEREAVTHDFNEYWDTHFNKAGQVSPVCRVPSCNHAMPPDPEPEDDTARRVITEPLGETVLVAFGRWQYLLGKSSEVDDGDDGGRMAELDALLTVAWRLAVLTLMRDGLGGVRPSTEQAAEEQLSEWTKEARC